MHSYTNKAISQRLTDNNYKLDGLTPQAVIIVKHMARAGSISLREAMADHSIQSLTRRITEIKDEGIAVRAERLKHPITGQRYTRYALALPNKVAV